MIRQAWITMGMPVTVFIRDEHASEQDVMAVASWFEAVNQRFSPFLSTSEVSRLNDGAIDRDQASEELDNILQLCEQTKTETGGYFDVCRNGRIDPSGLVKGWAIEKASIMLSERGFAHYFVEAGGDVQAVGLGPNDQPWKVGIRNPFKRDEQVKVLALSDRGVATSGTAVRGQHIYNPLQNVPVSTDVVSLTVIGPSIYDADRMATAAFAMGSEGILFLAGQPDLEAYAIRADGMAEYTKGFSRYVR
jgi:FAD:protein FMN transferase